MDQEIIKNLRNSYCLSESNLWYEKQKTTTSWSFVIRFQFVIFKRPNYQTVSSSIDTG